MKGIFAAWYDGVSVWTIFCSIPTSRVTAGLSLLAGLALLSMAIYFTPSSEAPFPAYDPRGKPSAAWKRFGYDRTPSTYIRNAVLGTTSFFFFLDMVLARHTASAVHFEVGEATVGMYGIFRVWETCFAGIIDGIGLPYWVYYPRSEARKDRCSARLSDERTSNPGQDRAKYTFDLLTSVRGVSWDSDRKFSVLSRRTERDRAEPPIPLSHFVRQRFIYLVICLVIVDIFDTLNKSRHWIDAKDVVSAILAGSPENEVAILIILHHHPITSLPWYQQPPFAFSVCVLTQLALEVFYTPFAMLCVGLSNLFPSVLLGMNSNTFLPLFHNPISFQTRTVADFWSAWHHIFKSSFQRLVDPLVYLFGIPTTRRHPRQVLKLILTFAFSALLHIILMHRAQRFSLRPFFELAGHDPVLRNRIHDAIWTPPWADLDTILFFTSQAFAMLFEQSVILPLVSWSERRIHPWSSIVLLRLWTYSWLLLSGRWWSDVWVRCGFWASRERVVPISIVRGVWKGDWFAEG